VIRSSTKAFCTTNSENVEREFASVLGGVDEKERIKGECEEGKAKSRPSPTQRSVGASLFLRRRGISWGKKK
jgi:hypothetical protein